jgi:hypothetical protein
MFPSCRFPYSVGGSLQEGLPEGYTPTISRAAPVAVHARS